jgi:hypothetical protein
MSERTMDIKTAIRSFKNVVNLAKNIPAQTFLEEGGEITAQQIMEIANERIKELLRMNQNYPA